MKTIAEALADELIAAANEDGQKSYTIKKRDELEKVAKTNRWLIIYPKYNTYISIFINMSSYIIAGSSDKVDTAEVCIKCMKVWKHG